MLKSLELIGFKSFADRTQFEFVPGITGIVGPNGSGKSNVVDAIKWILGDQSAKSLRGKEMTDVIFNGATARAPNSFAEATLTFDNTAGFLPIESQEVQIGRRISRGGDGEYLINRAPARLKDIGELLMGTGAGASAYCIIEQGRVDQILQANATSRRLVFEEAAGISRYKSRKTEALRKLDRVDQNLLRLTDIVDEVEAQLTSLRSQAAKAARYREVSQELRTLWVGLAADDFRRLSADLAEIERSGEELAAQIDKLAAEQQHSEGRLGALDVEIADVDDRLRKVGRQSTAHREQIASHKSTIRHQSARCAELDSELLRLRRQRVLMESRKREAVAQREHNSRSLEQFETQCAQRQKELEAEEARLRELSARLEAERQGIANDRESLAQKTRQLSDEEHRANDLRSQLNKLAKETDSQHQRSGELDQQIAGARAECDRRRLRVAEVENQMAIVSEKNQSFQEKRQTLTREHNQFQQTLLRLREQRSAGRARMSLLEDLERRQEGLGIGVKEILSRAQTSNYPPWNGVLGSVADLIQVDLEQAALLEVALGDRAQLIVLEDYRPLVEYLKRDTCEISGRVGFVAVGPKADTDESQAETRFLQETGFLEGGRRDLTQHPGVVERADRLVLSSKNVHNLGETLLSDTWIVETLEVALKLSAGPGQGCRFVTLQGELLSSGGALYVGTVQSESALVSRKSELRRLKNDLLELDRQIAAEEKRLADLGGSLTGVDAELETARSEIGQLLDRLAERKSDYADERRQLERLRNARKNVDDELADVAVREGQLRRELEKLQTGLARTTEEQQLLATNIEAREREVARLEHRLQTLEQKRATRQLDMAKQEERLNGLRTTHERLGQDVTSRSKQRDEVQRRFADIAAKRRGVVVQVLNSGAVLAELFLTEETSASKAAALLEEKEQLRSRRRTLQTEEARIRRQRHELNDRRHQQEMKARDIRHQIKTLEERIADEYQLALADVVAAGESAVRVYLDGRQRRRHADQAEQPDENRAPSGENESPGNSHPEKEETQSKPHPEPCQEPPLDEVRDEIQTQVNRLRRKLKAMGSVNTESLQNLDELEERYTRLSAQLEDLLEAKATLEEIVRRINAESKRLFTETFRSVQANFQELFRNLFGGGEGDIILEDAEDILECGIDVVARPPGKELRSISLLSGGEKTMTAIALLLAIFKSRPSPFCILDEVDASLDEANIDRFIGVLTEFQRTTQFIVVTHRKPTMTVADVLYGVTMEQSGVSKRMSVRFEDVRENGEFTTSSTNTAGSQSGDVTDAA